MFRSTGSVPCQVGLNIGWNGRRGPRDGSVLAVAAYVSKGCDILVVHY